MHTFVSAQSSRIAARPSRLWVAAIAALLGGVTSACTEPVPAAAISSLRIAPQSDSFYVGRATSGNPFAVTLLDARNAEINDGRPIAYSSSAPATFEVDPKTGVITGKTTGAGFFRATVSGRFIEAAVKIIAPVDRVQLNTGDFTIATGATRQLVPNLVSVDGSSLSGRAVTYSSSAPTIASVSTAGLVTAVNEGTATITVTSETKTATVVVTVQREAVASIRLTPQVSQLMRVGGQLQVIAQPLNGAGLPVNGRTVDWSTSNPAILTVTQQGVVTAVGVGNATVTALSETRVATLGVTVTEVPPRSVALEPDTFALATNLTRQLAPTVIDSAGRLVTSLNNRTVVWQSSSSIVASVSTTGVVAGTGAGTARISVTVDGVRSNDVVVQVSPQVASVVLTPFTPQLLRIGTTVQLTAQARDNANQPIAGKTANWSSNNPTIANVSQAGLVTGIAVGNTTITAEIDGRTASIQVTVTLVPVGSVTFAVSTDTLVENDVRQFNPVVRDTAGKVINSLIGRQVIYTSNNLPVANASNQGVVNAISQGVASIVATIDGVESNTLTIRVARVITVQVTPATATVAVGATQALTVVLKDLAGNTLTTSRPIQFSSNGPGIASVSQAGIVTGVATGGPVTITAQINGVSGTSAITVP
jgi:uncharacterized protein YjdB